MSKSKSTTFDWTTIRGELVGFEGEDLKVPGVVNEGNLVHVSLHLLKADPDGWYRDVWGDRWMIPWAPGDDQR